MYHVEPVLSANQQGSYIPKKNQEIEKKKKKKRYVYNMKRIQPLSVVHKPSANLYS